MKAFIYLITIILFSFGLHAQDGWDLIKTGKHISARQSFLQDLERDPSDEKALIGMITLSELEQDMLSYEEYVRELLTYHMNEAYFRLFGHVYAPFPGSIINNQSLPNSLKVAAYYELADSLFDTRAFNASESAYRKVIGDYNWSVIGPFSNESGSGHSEIFPIEKEQFLPDKIYPDETGRDFGWVEREIRNNNGMVVFDDHLPNNFAGTVYFANTFIELSQRQILQFRLARNFAVKLWVDDRLVFESEDKRNFNWDQDIVELDLEAGWHRILIKCSSARIRLKAPLLTFYDTKTYRDLSLVFNDELSSEFGDGSEFLNLMDNLGSRFAIRLTDQDGGNLAGIRSQFEAPFYNSNISVKTLSFYPTDDWRVGKVNTGEDLINYYLLTKSYFKHGYHREGQAFFEKITADIRYIPLIKYLIAKFYYANQQPEKAETALSGIDQSKSPIFEMLSIDLDLYKQDFEGSAYLSLLKKLESISPSNYLVIKGFIQYYEQQDLKGELKKYIQEVVELYPVYRPYLEKYTNGGRDAGKRKGNKSGLIDPDAAGEAMAQVEKRVVPTDYFLIIRYYEQIGEYAQAIGYIDELIELFPYKIDYLKFKSDLLVRNDDAESGIAVLKKALEIAPYDAILMESLGDLYDLVDDQKQALSWYESAKRYRNPYTFRSSKSLDAKIEERTSKGDYTELIQQSSLSDILSDQRYLNQYKYEDAIVVRYDKDVILLQSNEAEVRQLMVLKILTSKGAELWKEMDFSFFGELIEHEIISANGEKSIIMKSEGVLNLENLKAGDLVYLTGAYRWPLNRDLKDELSTVSYFGFNAPTFKSHFNVIVPSGQFIEFNTSDIDSNFETKSLNGYDRYQWRLIDLPKVVEESALVDESDVYASISLSTMKDWSKVVEWFDRKTYRKSDPTKETAAIIEDIVLNSMSAEERVEAVYNYVTKNFRYDPDYLSSNNYIPRSAIQTLSTGSGDAKDLASLLVALLRQIKMDAYYVLVRKSPANRSVLLPGLYFDHVIAGVRYDDKDHYLDATSDYYPYYVVSEQDANAWALRIRQGEKNAFRLPDDYIDPEKNLMEIDVNLALEKNEPLQFRVGSKAKGLVGGYFREYLNVATYQEQQQFILENFGYGVLDDVALVDMELGALKKITAPLQSEFTLSVNDFLKELIDETECRIPFMRTILPNPVVFSESREHELNLERVLQIDPVLQTISIRIPEGMALASLPDDVSFDNRFGTYELTFEKKGSILQIKKYQVFHQREIKAEDFIPFKEFYLKLLKSDGIKLRFRDT